MPRYKLTIEYNGTGLAGWQKQDEQPSVQALLETALEKYANAPCPTICAGRTDAGVHATGQVVHIDLEREASEYSIVQGINFHLLPSSQVVVVHAEKVPDDFSARFSAKKRCYLYRIINRKARLSLDHNRAWFVPESLDANAMHLAAQHLVGTHDFTSFRDTRCQAKSPIKTLERFDITRQQEEIQVVVEARSFLHHQVRNMVGTLRLIGNGKWNEAKLVETLAAKNRSAAGETAPPDGLYLTKVEY
jgi:tRNA pseudouridine38-40 synthase